MAGAKKYWDEFYEKNPHKDAKMPNPFLVDMLPRLSKGKVLDIAMGEGGNAVYLAQKGFDVKGFDISDVAVKHAKRLAADTGVEIEASQVDLDLFLMGLMEYDTIVMTRFKPPIVRYYSEMVRALKQGGTLLIESYDISEMGEAIAKDEAYRNIYFHSNELLRELKGLKIVFYQEAKIDGKHVVQCLARKPVDNDAMKYKFFDMATDKKEKDGKSKQLELAEKLFK